MIYNNARYYDPNLGRFISADTIVPGAGSLTVSPNDPVAAGAWSQRGAAANPQQLNRYSYGLNNPVKNTDPSGHCVPWCVGALVGAAVGGGIAYGAQVYNNYQSGMDIGQAMTTNINGAAIVTGIVAGAVVGGSLGLASTPALAGYTVSSALQLGAVGAASNMAGNAVGQYVTTGTVKTTDLAVAGVSGFAAGMAAPIVASTTMGALAGGYAGSIGLGATANVAQYTATQSINNDSITTTGLLTNGASGAFGGALGGPASLMRGLSYLKPSIEARNLIGQNVTRSNFARGLLGSAYSNYNFEPLVGAK